MFNVKGTETATPEQKKEIEKVLGKARLSLLGIGAKFGVGIFLANIATIFLGVNFLKDIDPENQIRFQLLAMFLNFVFMTIYLDGQLKTADGIVTSKIKEILKNKSE